MSWEDNDHQYRRHRFRRYLRRSVVWAFRLCLILLIPLLCLCAWYFYLSAQYDLSQVASMPERSVLLDRRGNEIATIHGSNRRLLTREQIPPFLVEALYAREDASFPDHPGIDVRGLARATVRNLVDRDFTQGASTLTMQLARNSFELRAMSLHRKFLEIALTLRIEHRYSKDEILTHYLNRIYFGSGAHGLGEASLNYFGLRPGQLNKHESALLVGIIRGPHAFSPFRHEELARAQAREVLDRLVATRQMRPGERDLILQQPLRLLSRKNRPSRSSHITAAVDRHLDVILDEHQIASGGLHIHTTIN
ncbi:MAG: transglycosylase domain-containing protein, partial [Verrucomicrobiales bacterium]